MQEEKRNLPNPTNFQEMHTFPSQPERQHNNNLHLQPASRTSEFQVYVRPPAPSNKPDEYQSVISLCDSPTVKVQNLPAGQADKDISQESRTSFDMSLVRPQYSFPTPTYNSPYQPPPPRRRRSELIGYTMDLDGGGPLFTSQQQSLNMYTADQSNAVKARVSAKFDRGFFMAENDWTCYRRNYFQISAAFTLQGSLGGPISGQENPLLFIDLPNQSNEVKQPNFQQVIGFSLGLTAKVANSEKRVELVQHTAKRDKGPQSVPAPKAVKPGGNITHSAVSANHNIITFERVQFKTATANNGKRRAAQQYYTVVVDLYATTSAGETHHVTAAYSQPLVVRGRSPGHYLDSNNPEQQLERYNSLPLGPSMQSADDRYFSPTHFRHVHPNDPLCRPYSPYSPYPPFSPATPVVATPSGLRNASDLSLLMTPTSPYPSQFLLTPTHNYLLPSISGSYYTNSPDMFSNDDVYDNQRNDIAGKKIYHHHESNMGLGLQGVLTGGEQGRRGDATNGKETSGPSPGISHANAMDNYAHNMWVSRSRTDSTASIASFVSSQSGYPSDENEDVPKPAPSNTQSFPKPNNSVPSNVINATSYLPAIAEFPNQKGYNLEGSFDWNENNATGSDAASHHLGGYHSDNESAPYNTILYPPSSSNSPSAHTHNWNNATSVSPPLPSPYRTETGHKQTLVKSKSLGYISMSTVARRRLQNQFPAYASPAPSPRVNHDGVRPRFPSNGSQRESVLKRRSDGNLIKSNGNGHAKHDSYQYHNWINDSECEPATNANECEVPEPPSTPTTELTTIITNLGFRMGRMEDGDDV